MYQKTPTIFQIWLKTWGGSGNEFTNDMYMDDQDRLYVNGSFTDGAISHTLDMFISSPLLMLAWL